MRNQSTKAITPPTLWLSVVVTIGMIGTMLAIHATYILQIGRRSHLSLPTFPQSFFPTIPASRDTTSFNQQYELPELFIYRRTKKTGSSSMLTALLEHLLPMGYTPLYYGQGEEMDAVVRNEYLPTHVNFTKRRRLLIAEHNHITRSYHPVPNSAVIADTVRDGYQQMTSYCRYVRKVKSCTGSEMLDCLRNPNTTLQNNYRWAGNEQEDEDTYIDLPLSSAHPALSTTILRRVFPNVTLEISRFNVRSSSCSENEEVRRVYQELYEELEAQISRLRQRILILTGYPYKVDKAVQGRVSITDVMKEAEQLEREKYDELEGGKISKVRGYSEAHHELMRMTKHWTLKGGKLSIKSRRK